MAFTYVNKEKRKSKSSTSIEVIVMTVVPNEKVFVSYKYTRGFTQFTDEHISSMSTIYVQWNSLLWHATHKGRRTAFLSHYGNYFSSIYRIRTSFISLISSYSTAVEWYTNQLTRMHLLHKTYTQLFGLDSYKCDDAFCLGQIAIYFGWLLSGINSL